VLHLSLHFPSCLPRYSTATLLIAACAPAAAQATPDQVVTFVAGSAHAGQRPLRLLDPLQPGARIQLAPGARLVVFRFGDSLETIMAGPGSFVVGREGIARAGAGGTLRQVRMDPAFGSAAAGLRNPVQAGVTVRSAATETADAPCEEAVAPGALVLRWREREHAGDYGVTVIDEGEQVRHAARTAEREAAVPDTVLAPGARYRWELTWRDASGSLRLAGCRFALLSALDAADMSRLRPAADASASRRVLFGLWLRARGAFAQAAPYLEH